MMMIHSLMEALLFKIKTDKMRYAIILPILAFAALSACNNNHNANKSDYRMVWNDEFDVNGLPDSNKWSYDTSGNSWGWGNEEAQWYNAGNIKNTEVKDGFLYISAIKEPTNGKDFSSGRIISKGKGDWLYGRAEIRAKVPGSRGIWPAIWMLSSDNSYGIWPASGEIDIMEHVGFVPDTVYASTHCQSYYFKIGTQKTKGIYLPNCDNEFHTYAMEWDSEEISMYCDTIKYFTFKNEHKSFKEWPFNKPFYLILNVAVGGTWGAVQGIDSTAYPQEMIVDYVRFFQK